MRTPTILSLMLKYIVYLPCNFQNSPGPQVSPYEQAKQLHVKRNMCKRSPHDRGRANTEKPGEGIIGAVATQVQHSLVGSDSGAVVYPAILTDYRNSESSGVAAMRTLIQDYTTRCPSWKIALLGCSQGAQVVGDVTCGTSETFFNSTPRITSS